MKNTTYVIKSFIAFVIFNLVLPMLLLAIFNYMFDWHSKIPTLYNSMGIGVIFYHAVFLIFYVIFQCAFEEDNKQVSNNLLS
jgi:hypothetical protein